MSEGLRWGGEAWQLACRRLGCDCAREALLVHRPRRDRGGKEGAACGWGR